MSRKNCLVLSSNLFSPENDKYDLRQLWRNWYLPQWTKMRLEVSAGLACLPTTGSKNHSKIYNQEFRTRKLLAFTEWNDQIESIFLNNMRWEAIIIQFKSIEKLKFGHVIWLDRIGENINIQMTISTIRVENLCFVPEFL